MFKNEQNKIKARLIIKEIFTVPVIILYILGICSVIIYKISLSNPETADFFINNIGYALRFILTGITYYIPFSLGEFILFASAPCAVIILVKFIIKIKRSDYKLKDLLKGLSRLAAFISAFIFIFAFTLGISYGASPVNKNIGFERRLISPEDLIHAMQILADEASAEAENIKYINEDGSTKMPYSLSELNDKLNQAFINLSERHDFLKLVRARSKPVIISEILSRMHITGIYSFFTGEANINIIFPDYTLPFTAAHEMAHLMGVAREDEANFTAFLACLYSGDSYIRYSGLVKMAEYLRSPLYSAAGDEDFYKIIGRFSNIIKNEWTAYSLFFDKYRDEPIAKVSSAVNNTYLKSQGQEQGTKSYGLVVDLAAVYLRDIYIK